MPYTARRPHRMADLARLLRYLLVGRSTDPELNDGLRLAGPPYTRRLVQRYEPWGESYQAAAMDLAYQLFEHARTGLAGMDRMPRQIYVHVVSSFAPQRRSSSVLGSANALGRSPDESDFSIAGRITRDVLDAMGIGEHYPLILVVHGDRRHVHAHAVVGLHVGGSPSCRLPTMNGSTIRSIARAADAAYNLPATSPSLRRRHAAVVGAMPITAADIAPEVDAGA